MVVSVIPTASFECRSSILFYDLLQTSVLDALENKTKNSASSTGVCKKRSEGGRERDRKDVVGTD